MAREVSIQKAFNTFAEKTIDHDRILRRDIDQRRNGMEDLYGVAFTEYGDTEKPATFYISISPDMVYLERFAFKFVIKPYVTTVTGGTDAQTVIVNNRSLATEDANATNPHKHDITPNPHNHTTQPHTHNLISGISYVNTTSDYWRIKIAGVDITDYLIEQHDGDWINGEGIYPNNRLDDLTDFYDILDVASVLTALDTEESLAQRDRILKPEMKKVEIISDAPFGVEAYLYLKLSHVNR